MHAAFDWLLKLWFHNGLMHSLRECKESFPALLRQEELQGRRFVLHRIREAGEGKVANFHGWHHVAIDTLRFPHRFNVI